MATAVRSRLRPCSVDAARIIKQLEVDARRSEAEDRAANELAAVARLHQPPPRLRHDLVEIVRGRLIDEAEGQGPCAVASAAARLWISRSSSLVLAITTCSPVIERSRVVLRPIRSTVPVRLVELDRVAAPERLVEQDRERREQVRENALRGEADRDAADAEAGDQRGDVDAEIVEDEDDRRSRTTRR